MVFCSMERDSYEKKISFYWVCVKNLYLLRSSFFLWDVHQVVLFQ